MYQCFSKLIFFPKIYKEDEVKFKIDELIDSYINGVKITVITVNNSIYKELIKAIEKCYKDNKIYYENGQVHINFVNKDIAFDNTKDYFSVFNLDIINLSKEENVYDIMEIIEVIDGDINLFENNKLLRIKVLLNTIHNSSTFNFDSYEIQHKNEDENIMITASAGTGKTYSMINRILYLIHKNDYKIDFIKYEILLITFTNKATEEMKSRLKKTLENYYKLTKRKKYILAANEVVNMSISTIHSFCLDLIRANSEKIGYSNNFEITSSIFEYRNILFSKMEQNINVNIINFLLRNNVTMRELKESTLKFYQKIITKNIDILGNDLNWGSVNKECKELMEFIITSLKESYDEYNKINIKDNKINLADVNKYLKKLLPLIDNNVINFNNKYKYVFIDEFQDTDDIQINLIADLMNKYNFYLFIVGDIKQAIYRFRGADITSFNKLKEKSNRIFCECVLNKNYRTNKKLAMRVNTVFKNIMYKGLIPKDNYIISRVSNENNRYKKVALKYNSNEEVLESIYKIYKEIKSEIKINEYTREDKKTIAILVRNNRQVKEIINKFNKEGMFEIKTSDNGDLYNSIEAIELLKLINALIFNEDLDILYELINSNYINIEIPNSNIYLFTKKEKQRVLIETINNVFVDKFNLTYYEFCNVINNEGCGIRILEVINILKPWNTANNPLQYKRNLERILDLFMEYRQFEYWNLVQLRENLTISIYTSKAEESTSINTSNVVYCDTIHKAKGLEYDYVIYPYYPYVSNLRLQEVEIEGNKVAYSFKIGDKYIKNDNYSMTSCINSYKETMKDEARLVYVALTRAKEYIFYIDKASNKEWSNIFDEK